MKNQSFDELKNEALALSEADRAALALELVSSLDGGPDQNVETEWDAEIRRRLAEIDSGTATLIDRDEFRRRIRQRLAAD